MTSVLGKAFEFIIKYVMYLLLFAIYDTASDHGSINLVLILCEGKGSEINAD